MAGTFPTLKSGNTVFYPVKQTQQFLTGVMRFMDDSEQRWRSGNVRVMFDLQLTNVNSYDISLIQTFFRSQFGKFDTTWSLTIGADTWDDLAFDQDDFVVVENLQGRFTTSLKIVQVKSSKPTIPAAPTYFPQINANGITTQLPYQTSVGYRTQVGEMDFGKRYTYKWRANPLGEPFTINIPVMTDAELAVLQDFVLSVEGRLGAFIFLDPAGNLVPYSDDYSNASWVKSGSLAVSTASTDPFGGLSARNMVNSNSNGSMYAVVLPDGNATGMVICGSAWVLSPDQNATLSISFSDGTTTYGAQTFTLPQGIWVRVKTSITVATNAALRFVLGGSSTWGSFRLRLFSVQTSALPGPGTRLLTPGADALRRNCRLESDSFTFTRVQNNVNSAVVPVREFYA